jgi:5-oxoprolinase (ATP-hydrolysing)
VRLEVFGNLFMSIAEQMGHVLRRTALSTNIRERLDFSCAVFDAEGGLVANAPHIPVHLGAMSETVRAVRRAHPSPAPGDVFATNDPAEGGSHLPDVTVVSPLHGPDGALRFFVASRGHHADIGGVTPGSMPPFSTSLEEEGVVLRHLPIVRGGAFDEAGLRAALAGARYPARRPDENVGDIEAHLAANRLGARLLDELCARYGEDVVRAYMGHVQTNAAAAVREAIAARTDGEYAFEDALDDGGRVAVRIDVRGDRMRIDFRGTSGASPGNANAPRAVTLAAVLYVLRTMVGKPIPLNGGCLEPVEVILPPGCLLDPPPGRAVAAGNVETSQRVVDVLLGALGLAAASQGTMNNLTFGDARFGYYETLGGGAGALPGADGASGVHTHMTNSRITDPEVLEARFPVRLRRFSLRPGSGGRGRHRGGDGLIREIELLAPLDVAILAERRRTRPFGLAGGEPGAPGRNLLDGRELPGRVALRAEAGAVLRIETPGGGGYGAPGPDGAERDETAGPA